MRYRTIEILLDIANRRWWAEHNTTDSNRIASGPRYGDHGMELRGRRSVSVRMVRLPAAAVETGQDAMMPDVKLSANHREVTHGRGEGRLPGHFNLCYCKSAAPYEHSVPDAGKVNSVEAANGRHTGDATRHTGVHAKCGGGSLRL